MASSATIDKLTRLTLAESLLPSNSYLHYLLHYLHYLLPTLPPTYMPTSPYFQSAPCHIRRPNPYLVLRPLPHHAD